MNLALLIGTSLVACWSNAGRVVSVGEGGSVTEVLKGAEVEGPVPEVSAGAHGAAVVYFAKHEGGWVRTCTIDRQHAKPHLEFLRARYLDGPESVARAAHLLKAGHLPEIAAGIGILQKLLHTDGTRNDALGLLIEASGADSEPVKTLISLPDEVIQTDQTLMIDTGASLLETLLDLGVQVQFDEKFDSVPGRREVSRNLWATLRQLETSDEPRLHELACTRSEVLGRPMCGSTEAAPPAGDAAAREGTGLTIPGPTKSVAPGPEKSDPAAPVSGHPNSGVLVFLVVLGVILVIVLVRMSR